MAAVPDDGMIRPPGPAPLGAILVQRGVLTPEQLTAALAEQKRSGEQLGEIIVRLGFAVAPLIGQGLATQHGGLLKTEYGFAVGFGGGTPTRRVLPPPVSPEEERSTPLRLASATAAESAALRARSPVEVPAALAERAQPAPDEVVLKWQKRAQELAAQRDAALRDLQASMADRAASAAALQAATARSAELEAAAARFETEREALARAGDEASSHNKELKRTHEKLEAAAARVAELEATVALAQAETAKLDRARAEAVSRNSELEHKLEKRQAEAAAREDELAAATARLAELDAARAAGESDIHALSMDAGAEKTRVRIEKAELEEARDALASRNADLEDRLKTLEAAEARAAQLEQRRVEASAKIRQLEAERNEALAVARTLGEQQREHHPDEHADDRSHLLFAPVRDGYLLFQQDGPPPAPGSTLQFTENDGTTSKLLVAKIGAPPLPGVHLCCAYLIEAE
jgi:hypothetical protein